MLRIGDMVTEVKLLQEGHWSGFQRAEFLKVIYEVVSKNIKFVCTPINGLQTCSPFRMVI